MNIQDQIARLKALRDQKAAAQLKIQEKVAEEGRTKDAAEREEFSGLTSEITMIDAELADLEAMEAIQATKAAAVAGANPVTAAKARGAIATGGAPAIHVDKEADEKFKGQQFTRMVIAKALARLEDRSPIAIAQERWGKSNPKLVEVLKAAVQGGSTDTWGAELVTINNRYNADFIEYLYSKTVYDQLPLRTIPANVQIKGQDGAATAYWVGESKAIPATKADYNNVNMTPLKVAALAVVSNELLKYSDPSAEMLVRDALVQASSQRVDQTFISTAAAVSGVSPAGILNGVSPISSSGSDIGGLIEDIKALYAPFIAANNASGLSFVTTESLGKSISLMQTPLGAFQFPGIGANGGALLGDPVATGGNVPAGAMVLLKPSDIFRIGDTGIEVSISREAYIEQDTAPTGATDTPTAASANGTSMFQEESTAIKVVRPINFAKRRASAVQWINNADYGAVTS